MITVETLNLVIRDTDSVDHEAVVKRTDTGYELTFNERKLDFVIVNSEAEAVISLIRSSTSKLFADTMGDINSTTHANLRLETPDKKTLPVAVVKGDYLMEPGSIIIAFNNKVTRSSAVGIIVTNTYSEHEIIGTIVKVQVAKQEEN